MVRLLRLDEPYNPAGMGAGVEIIKPRKTKYKNEKPRK
jgi:hypothetical protein